ncbi:MAG: hypothetical protein RJQ09_09080 [Cyclobacteriaceae bacterium]
MKNNSRHPVLITIIGLLIGLLIIVEESHAQDQGFIYGKVTTIDGTVYTGQIRWGKEETFWSDQFDAEKIGDNRGLKKEIERRIHDERENRWGDINWRILSIWEDYSGSSHQFTIQFGDIKSIEYHGRNRILLTLKDGSEIPLEGEGYNDVGARVQVMDFELGEITIDGNRIDRVDFVETPSTLPSKFGNPLNGTVYTFRKGEFKGLITWDHDENLHYEKLDGDSRDGEVSIPFGNIKSIISEGRGSKVVLTSGREMYLRGSNDVNGDNNGIWVNIPELGQIDIKWRDFDRVEFDHTNNDTGPGYSTYKRPVKLQGTVVTVRNERFSGNLVFDLDEEYDFEMLDGSDDYVKFEVPFRNIRRLRPKNYNYSSVELKNGQVFLLGDHRDVSDDNDGIIVLSSDKDEHNYIPWQEVDEIIFK